MSAAPGSTIPDPPKNNPIVRTTNKDIENLNEKIKSKSFKSSIAPSSKSVTDDYLIGPGDLLEVEVYGSDDLNDQVRVNSFGMVSYPLLGEVEVGELSTSQAEDKFEGLLGEKYIRDPSVNVFIKEYRSKHVAVLGAVRNPGNYELLKKGRLIDALALAGGLSGNASKVIYLARSGDDNMMEIDLDEVNKGNLELLEIPVQIGDTIYVPEAGVYYVNGAVRRPGQFPIIPGVTFSQAIQIAGGLRSGSQNVRLVRYENGQQNVIPVDVKAIESGAEQDIPLQDRDIVIVGQNAIVAFFQQFRMGLNFWPFPVNVSSGVPDVPQ
jgi:polysaccharide export outer membrane protein